MGRCTSCQTSCLTRTSSRAARRMWLLLLGCVPTNCSTALFRDLETRRPEPMNISFESEPVEVHTRLTPTTCRPQPRHTLRHWRCPSHRPRADCSPAPQSLLALRRPQVPCTTAQQRQGSPSGGNQAHGVGGHRLPGIQSCSLFTSLLFTPPSTVGSRRSQWRCCQQPSFRSFSYCHPLPSACMTRRLASSLRSTRLQGPTTRLSPRTSAPTSVRAALEPC